MQQTTVTIRFPEDMEYKLSIAAAYDRMNRTEIIRKLVAEYIDNHPMLKEGGASQSESGNSESSSTAG